MDDAYLSTLEFVLNAGNKRESRAGNTIGMFGMSLNYDLSDGTLPVVQSRPVFPRISIEEMMFFLRGETDTKLLEKKGINIWKENTSREFLDAHGLSQYPEGEMGLGYGWQMRHWQGQVDQIENLITGLIDDPYGRRHIVTHWNPAELKAAALPPCHMFHQYYINQNGSWKELSSTVYLRSSDLVFGLPYNIIQYAFLNRWLCEVLNQRTATSDYHSKDLNVVLGDAHIYENQIQYVKNQLLQEKMNHRRYDLEPLKPVTLSFDWSSGRDPYQAEVHKEIVLSKVEHLPELPDKPSMNA